MRILISGDCEDQCYEFEKYLRKYIDTKLEIKILRNFYSRKVKNPNKLGLYNLNLYLMYSTVCGFKFNSFIQSLRERTHRLNIIKYSYLIFLSKFFKNNPKLYFFIYKFLWNLIINRYIFTEKFRSLFYERNKEPSFHFHLGCLTTNIELETCIRSKIQKNRLFEKSYWRNM